MNELIETCEQCRYYRDRWCQVAVWSEGKYRAGSPVDPDDWCNLYEEYGNDPE